MSALIDFESSWKKSAEREETRRQREIVLEKAKHRYEKEEKRKAEAKQRGEDTWMLSSVNDRIQNEQKDLEKVKSKKTKKKKKKDKKKKKKKDSSESDSDSEDEPQWVEKKAETQIKGPVKGPQLQRDSWMMAPMDLDTLPGATRAELRAKKKEEEEERRRQQEMLNEAGQHKRELNPYWKDGGTGLPEKDAAKRPSGSSDNSKPAPVVIGDGGVGWLKKALKRCYEQAEEEKRNVEEIAAEKYGSLNKLKSMLKEAEEKLEQNKAEIRFRKRDEQSRTNVDSPRSTQMSTSRDRKYESRERSRSKDRKYQRSRSRDRNSKNRDRSRDRKYKRSQSRSSDRKYNTRSRSRSRSRDRKYKTRSRSRSSDKRHQRSRSRETKSSKKGSKSFQRPRSSSRDSSTSSSSSSSDSSHNKGRDRRYQSRHRSRSRDRLYQSKHDRKKTESSRFKKPCSDSDDDNSNKVQRTKYSYESVSKKSESSRDSQPSWKKKSFIKPSGDDSDDDNNSQSMKKMTFKKPVGNLDECKEKTIRETSWKKKSIDSVDKRKKDDASSESSGSSSSGESSSESDDEKKASTSKKTEEPSVVLLSEEEMNKLGAKLLKAEMMGNETLAAELKAKLEACRKAKLSAPKEVQTAVNASNPTEEEDRVVVLTRVDKKGMVRPLGEREHPKEPRQGRRKKKQKVETHSGNEGARTRYFHDDDKHDLKSLVEQERMGTAEDSNMMFARLAGRSLEKTNDDYQIDDVFVDRASKKESESKAEDRDRFTAIMEHKKMAKAMENCQFCFDKVPKHLIIAIGIKCYLCLPSHKSLSEGHCLIVPMQHVTQGTVVDEDVWDEIQIFRKGLTKMFEEQDEDCVFMEMSRNLKYHPHMFIDCVPMPKEVGDMAPIYFKKAIMESESEWAQNKKLVDLSEKNIRRSVPKGFPYFSVDFGLQGGFAHVIEDEKEFPPYFGREVVGGMLDVGPDHWRKPHKENFEEQRKKVLRFSELWKPYDWTQKLAGSS